MACTVPPSRSAVAAAASRSAHGDDTDQPDRPVVRPGALDPGDDVGETRRARWPAARRSPGRRCRPGDDRSRAPGSSRPAAAGQVDEAPPEHAARRTAGRRRASATRRSEKFQRAGRVDQLGTEPWPRLPEQNRAPRGIPAHQPSDRPGRRPAARPPPPTGRSPQRRSRRRRRSRCRSTSRVASGAAEPGAPGRRCWRRGTRTALRRRDGRELPAEQGGVERGGRPVADGAGRSSRARHAGSCAAASGLLAVRPRLRRVDSTTAGYARAAAIRAKAATSQRLAARRRDRRPAATSTARPPPLDPAQPASAERSILRRWAKAASITAKTSLPRHARRRRAAVRAARIRTSPESTLGTGQNTARGTAPARVARGVPGRLHAGHAVDLRARAARPAARPPRPAPSPARVRRLGSSASRCSTTGTAML